VKTRDFEVPGTGGGAYVTSYSKDLVSHFDIGREIFCYRDRWELVELLRELLNNQSLIAEAAQVARARCLRDHRWLHRYKRIAEVLQIC
jgi:spore maturation protein CgeB